MKGHFVSFMRTLYDKASGSDLFLIFPKFSAKFHAHVLIKVFL